MRRNRPSVSVLVHTSTDSSLPARDTGAWKRTWASATGLSRLSTTVPSMVTSTGLTFRSDGGVSPQHLKCLSACLGGSPGLSEKAIGATAVGWRTVRPIDKPDPIPIAPTRASRPATVFHRDSDDSRTLSTKAAT